MWPYVQDPRVLTEPLSGVYNRARPFRHIVLDGVFQDSALEELSKLFSLEDGWQQYEGKKRGNASAAVLHHAFLTALQGGGTLDFLRQLTGVPELQSDPTIRGGGLHCTSVGGALGIHVDFNRHPALPLQRRVNTILYLNRDWRPEWKGDLILTDRAEIDHRIEPRWNRWVIFDYSHQSWHGHPEPLACPANRQRQSLALYYYVPLSDEMEFHTTQYAEQPK